ncbi:C4-dicarboxylate ABC transporter substrate-binding protein [Allopusillimonas soli]|uniref:TRAP transporter substrate-binding protein DctP n=1 Tax=Allopusillimonas soli TaxID=659016 RepID=A0A853F5P7_9BURK|nr:TRAP transporter substrate-binding protein DctP [Allopusillimonas soli]NYT35854.1 TRAP transporter substrate-binding protein DctP [Allopusillimonas soli]TEA76221.1 C4-dicarboxylate ABC transporter substrate-binding protein [Allopusillimonas soli]
MKSTLRALAAAALFACVAVPAAAADISWRVPTSVPEGSPFYKNFLERFADHVDTLTSGRVEIQPFGAGVIVPALKVFQAVEEGTVPAGHSTSSYLVNQDPTNAIFAGFPGGMGPDAYMAWLYEGGGKDMLQKLRDKQGLKTLIVGIGSSEIMAHANKPIRNAEDLKGLKYRTSGAWAEVMRDYFGAVPTVVPPGETYTLLQRKGVDAVEWAPPSANMPEGFHQAAKYIVVPGVHQPTFMWEVVVKQETWDKLPDDIKPLLEAAARLTTHESLTHFYDADMKAMAQYRKGRNEIITLSPEFVKQLSDAGRDWIHKTAKAQADSGNATMSEILKDYDAYHERWKAESGYLIRD